MRATGMAPEPIPGSTESVKQCRARHYESDPTKLVLGPSFRPGGLKLTGHLGTLVHLTPESRVLDVASGQRASAIFLAERFCNPHEQRVFRTL